MKVEFKNPWRGLRGLPADVWIIFATSLVNRAGMMALPFLILYLTKYLSVSPSLAGLALSAYGIGGVVTAPIAGRLSDRVGPFTVMRASLALSGVILLVFPLVHSFPVVVGMTFLWAVIADAARPATLSALTETTGAEQRKAAIAVNRLGVNLGMSIGPAVGGFLALVSFPMLFVVDGLTSLAAAGVLTTLLWSQRRELAAAHKAAIARGETVVKAKARAKREGRSMYRDGRAMAFFASMILIGLVFMQHQGIMPLYLVRDLHYKESFYGLLFMLNTLIIVAVEVPLNLAMSRWSHRRATMLGLALLTIGFSAIGLFSGATGIVATTIVWTFGEMILFPVATAYVADLAPAGRSGEYMGGYSSTFSLSMIVGPWAGTVVLDHFGANAAWSAVFVCGAAAVAVLAFTPRENAAESGAEGERVAAA